MDEGIQAWVRSSVPGRNRGVERNPEGILVAYDSGSWFK